MSLTELVKTYGKNFITSRADSRMLLGFTPGSCYTYCRSEGLTDHSTATYTGTVVGRWSLEVPREIVPFGVANAR